MTRIRDTHNDDGKREGTTRSLFERERAIYSLVSCHVLHIIKDCGLVTQHHTRLERLHPLFFGVCNHEQRIPRKRDGKSLHNRQVAQSQATNFLDQLHSYTVPFLAIAQLGVDCKGGRYEKYSSGCQYN
jgi:hypothetical protein